jgi:hypothetical protein
MAVSRGTILVALMLPMLSMAQDGTEATEATTAAPTTAAPTMAPTTAPIQNVTTSTCSQGVCTKGKWMLFFGGKTDAECKSLCEDARREVPVPDGVLEEVYSFRQDGQFKMVKGGKIPAGHERMVKEINYRSTRGYWNGWPRWHNHFYGHWEGQITITTAGTYKFFTTSDDGSRLFVDDKHVVDNPGWHGMRMKEGSLELTAGKHPFSADFFEGGGGAGMEVHWQGPDTNNQRIIMKTEDDIAEKGYQFSQNGQFHDMDKEAAPMNPKTTRKVKNINYRGTSDYWPGWTIRDHFYARWSGYVNIKAAGKYTFYTKSDDGSRMYVDDKSVVDNPGWHGMRERQGTIENMAAGKHKFWAEMFEGGGGAGMEMFYSGPDTGNQKIIVPESVLSSSLNGGGETELNADWKPVGKCAAYSTVADSSCILYTECTQIGFDADSQVCEGDGSTNGFDWVHPAVSKTCKYTSAPPPLTTLTTSAPPPLSTTPRSTLQ